MDLQCPATAVLVDDAGIPPSWLARLPIAGRFGCRGHEALVALVNATADLFRGETFVVAAPSPDIEEALRSQGVAAVVPLVIEVDSEGWRRVPPPP